VLGAGQRDNVTRKQIRGRKIDRLEWKWKARQNNNKKKKRTMRTQAAPASVRESSKQTDRQQGKVAQLEDRRAHGARACKPSSIRIVLAPAREVNERERER
jgi:hypothetical protein